MNRYAIYDTTAGLILRIVQCAPAFAAIQIGEGEAFIEVDDGVTDQTHKVVDGALVPLP